MVKFFIFSFFVSFCTTYLIIRYQQSHAHLILDDDLCQVQKNHDVPVPRIGGVGIFLSISISSFLYYFENSILIAILVICALPAFLSGLAEDITKSVRPLARLFFICLSSVAAGIFLNAWLTSLALPYLDFLMTFGVISLLFTCFAVTGVVNAFNLIDGFNGLASFIAIIVFLSLAYVAHEVGDLEITTAALMFSAAIFGFFIWNYPFGKVFLGDGGAYLIGFLVAELSVLLVVRNPEVSVWFPFVLIFYPIFETIHTIYRRFFITKASLVAPDAAHLHQLIHKKLVTLGERQGPRKNLINKKNSITSPFLWGITLFCVFPAIMYYDDTAILKMLAIILFCIFSMLYFFMGDRKSSIY